VRAAAPLGMITPASTLHIRTPQPQPYVTGPLRRSRAKPHINTVLATGYPPHKQQSQVHASALPPKIHARLFSVRQHVTCAQVPISASRTIQPRVVLCQQQQKLTHPTLHSPHAQLSPPPCELQWTITSASHNLFVRSPGAPRLQVCCIKPASSTRQGCGVHTGLCAKLITPSLAQVPSLCCFVWRRHEGLCVRCLQLTHRERGGSQVS
jgi:hypothetical protein